MGVLESWPELAVFLTVGLAYTFGKLKLGKLYGEQWFQFHLEAMPPQFVNPGMMRGARRAIYGRR